jgi:hypothetical protein
MSQTSSGVEVDDHDPSKLEYDRYELHSLNVFFMRTHHVQTYHVAFRMQQAPKVVVNIYDIIS